MKLSNNSTFKFSKFNFNSINYPILEIEVKFKQEI